MPGIHTTEVLKWKPMSELSKHGDSMMVLCVLKHERGGKFYFMKLATNASGNLRSLEPGLPLLSKADSVPCAWCYMPQGVDLSEDEPPPKKRVLQPKLKLRSR